MANSTALKRRITSIKNTRQITKAMELVAASKMRKAQQFAIQSREFKEQAKLLIGQLAAVSDVKLDGLFVSREIKSQLIIVVSSDRGLAGAYNSNIFKGLANQIKQNRAAKIQSKVVTIGRQAGTFVAKLEGVQHEGAYPSLGDQISSDEIVPIIDQIVTSYSNESIDSVVVIYTKFVSNIRQDVLAEQIIPYEINFDDAKTKAVKELSPLEVAIFEPSVEEILQSTATRLIEAQLWQALLEATASEHSMRMMAMKNASDNAKDIIEDLTLELNTARQAAITQEIAEIVGGAEAVKV